MTCVRRAVLCASRIVDLNHYDRMVSGVDACVMYASNEAKGIKTMKATYEVSALKMGVKYYVEHQCGPPQS